MGKKRVFIKRCRILRAYGMKYCIDGRIGCLAVTGLRPDKSTRGMGRSSASPRGFESGDSNMSKLTIVFATMELDGPRMCSRLVMPNPLAIIRYLFFEASKRPFECFQRR
jgi:hypothetical protein